MQHLHKDLTTDFLNL